MLPQYALTAGGEHFVVLPSILAPGALAALPVPNFDALYSPAKLIPLALIAVIASLSRCSRLKQ